MQYILFVLFFFLWPNISQAAVVHVQQCSDTSGFNNGGHFTDSCSFPGGTSAGDTLIVTCQWGATDTSVTVTDSNGDHFTEGSNVHYFDYGSGDEGMSIFYYPNVAAGVTSVTCNFGSEPYVTIAAHEYSGLLKSGVFDRGAISHGTLGGGSNNGIDGPMTTSTNGELVYVAFLDDTANVGFTATAGTNSLAYTLRANISATGDFADEDAILTNSGSVTGSMSDATVGDTYVMSMAAFKSTVGAIAKLGIARINNGKFGY